MTVVVVVVFLLLLGLGVPIVFVLGISGACWLYLLGDPSLFPLISQRLFSGMFSYPLLAVPFFVLAGALMSRAGITERLVRFSNLLVGKLPGSLAHVNIVSSIFFAGISGSAVADTAAIGSLLIPAMKKSGYDLDFSAAVTASSSVIGPIIPPSIIMVIYAYSAGVSVGGMFAAGFVPGLLVGIGLMIIAHIFSVRKKYVSVLPNPSRREILVIIREAVVALIMPIIILGGILSGIFTATEASAVAVGYALFVGFLVLRTLKLSDLPSLFMQAAFTTSMVLLIIGAASILSWVIASEGIPGQLTALLLSISNDPRILILLLNIFFLVLGMFMDTSAAIIIFAPIFAPFAVKMGFHPLHFGIIMCVNLIIGLATPPLGLCIFVAGSISKLSLERISRAIFPFILVEIAVIFIVTYFPALSMFIPRVLGYY